MLWLRTETKFGERRTALTPAGARKLVAQGVEVVVERSETRVFPDRAYLAAGCRLAEPGEWRRAPTHALVLGLKELPSETAPLRGRHCYFGHLYKGQEGAAQVLERFGAGRGELLDLEYMTDAQGRRVAAFGFWAGYVGAALGLLAWARREKGRVLAGPLVAWPDREALVATVERELNGLRAPRVMITGALGRSGSGARQLLDDAGLNQNTRRAFWDRAETAGGGPFDEVAAHDVLIHCVGTQAISPPLVTAAQIERGLLAVIADVTADFGNPTHQLPVVDALTSLREPVAVRRLGAGAAARDLHFVAIDHLPTLLPKESSEDFAEQLLPHLIDYFGRGISGAWLRTQKVYQEHRA